MPAVSREIKSNSIDCSKQAYAKTIYDRHAPAVLTNRTGRRPMRSLRRPHMGEKINCMKYKAPVGMAMKECPALSKVNPALVEKEVPARRKMKMMK